MAVLQTSIPPLPMTPGMTVTFEALDPTTGAVVGGVLISQAVIYAADSADIAEAPLPELPALLTFGPQG